MNDKERQELVKYRIKKARETFNEVGLHVLTTIGQIYSEYRIKLKNKHLKPD